jgi:hypothetical protein
MKLLKLSSVFTWMMCLTACVSTDGVSTPVSFPSAPQYKLKSAAHWKLIAEDVAGQIKQALIAKEQTLTPIFLDEPAHPTPFERNFFPMLRSALLAQSLQISTQKEESAKLQVQVNKVSHVATYRSGTLTLLGGGLLVLRDIVTHESTYLTNAGGALAAVAADIAMTHHRPPPDLELVLSASIQKDKSYLTSNTQIYYLQSEDQFVYQHPPVMPPTSRDFPVKGAGDRR